MIFCKIQPPEEKCVGARQLFCADIKKLAECHFMADVMLKQSCIPASRANLPKKLQGLRVASSKNFSRATFFVFWST